MATNIQTRIETLAMSLALVGTAPDDKRATKCMRMAKRASKLCSRRQIVRANAKLGTLIIEWQKDGAKINRWVKGQEPTPESIGTWERHFQSAKILSDRLA